MVIEMKSEIIKKLRETDGYVSGQEICDSFGVSRTAVWKAINSLKEEGFLIEAVPNKGYHLEETPDVLSKSEIESRLLTEWIGKKLYCYEKIDSTNTECKRLAEKVNESPDGTLVVTEKQVAGRGRRGRAWTAEAGTHLAMSLLLRPMFQPDRASMLTLVMALSVAEGIDEICKTDTQIKWPNDIVLNKKKICGILTEMNTELDFIHYVVIGIGINVNTRSFPEEISDTATSIRKEMGREFSRASIIAAIMRAFEKNYALFVQTQDLSLLQKNYEKKLANLNKEVRVLDPNGEYSGVAAGINTSGELLVNRENGEQSLVYAGEVSVRGIYGYI